MDTVARSASTPWLDKARGKRVAIDLLNRADELGRQLER